jgi:hypothetical protein
MNMKIGRNETCPCGSGKKHKKCCDLADQIKLSFARQRKIGTQDEHIKEEPQLICHSAHNLEIKYRAFIEQHVRSLTT